MADEVAALPAGFAEAEAAGLEDAEPAVVGDPAALAAGVAGAELGAAVELAGAVVLGSAAGEPPQADNNMTKAPDTAKACKDVRVITSPV